MAAHSVTRWADFAKRAQRRYGVPATTLLGLVEHESSGQEGLTSSAGAEGLTQFMPGTAGTYHVNVAPGHAKSQIFGAAKYLRDLGYAKDPVLALNSYAAGPANPGAAGNYGSTVLDLAKKYEGVSGHYQGGSPGKAPGRDGTVTTTTGYKPTDNQGARQQAALNYLSDGDVVNLAANLASATEQTPVTVKTLTPSIRNAGKNGPLGQSGYLGKVERRAGRIDAHHFNYQWGGGHNPATQHQAIPLDCSGAVSKVLGLDPRVASQFESFGKSGEGKHITIYAKDTHVLMKINGKFWGTSGSNPGGGAGWIPASALSSSYLSGFVARHPKGL